MESVVPIPIFSTQLDELRTEVTGALGRLGRVDEDKQTLLEKINNLGGRLAALDSKDGEERIVKVLVANAEILIQKII